MFGGEHAPYEPQTARVQARVAEAMPEEEQTTATVDMNRAQEMVDAQALEAAREEIAAAEAEAPIAMPEEAEDEDQASDMAA